jgi:hypothetical protein
VGAFVYDYFHFQAFVFIKTLLKALFETTIVIVDAEGTSPVSTFVNLQFHGFKIPKNARRRKGESECLLYSTGRLLNENGEYSMCSAIK